jgi:hypothetical protein
MSKGVILFAFNTEQVDYFKMAIATAKRVNHFLNLPVSIVTNLDQETICTYDYQFDKVFITTADPTNTKDKAVWINKGRYKAFYLSPYDETLVLDADYLINSATLLHPFNLYHDFMCHANTSFLMVPNAPQENLSEYAFNTLWATVMYFKKTKRVRQIFDCMEMIQNNFPHYISLYNFLGSSYRNDYALTLAIRMINGQTESSENYIPWNLVHVGKNTTVYRESDNVFNTEYTVIYDNWAKGKIRKEYCKIRDSDFHLLNKKNYMELVDD